MFKRKRRPTNEQTFPSVQSRTPVISQPQRRDGQVISRPSEADLEFARENLVAARTLLHEEIQFRTEPRPEFRRVLRENIGNVDSPGMISVWHGNARLCEEVYWWSDMDDAAREPWVKCTKTPGYWWDCKVVSGPGSGNPGIAILMTVSANRVVEVSTWPPAKGPDAIILPATLENFRTIFDRIDKRY